MRNTFVYEECNKRVEIAQLRWFGHHERMSNERLMYVVYAGNIHGARLQENVYSCGF